MPGACDDVSPIKTDAVKGENTIMCEGMINFKTLDDSRELCAIRIQISYYSKSTFILLVP